MQPHATPKLSVIIPCFNAAGTLGVQLEALARQKCDEPWEVIVSDNGSNDSTRSIVESYKCRLPDLRVVDSSDRKGAAHARNVAALIAGGESLVFCDADDEVDAGWLAAMGRALAQSDFVACRVDFEKLNRPSLASVFRDHPQHFGLQKSSYTSYYHAGGGTLGVKKRVHHSIGGFDPSLIAHEDTDYCYRIQMAGFKLHFVSDAVLHVRCADTFGELFQQQRLWGELNILIFKRYRTLGASLSEPWKRFAREWRSLAQAFWRIRSEEAMLQWGCDLGWLIGVLHGTIKYRVPPS